MYQREHLLILQRRRICPVHTLKMRLRESGITLKHNRRSINDLMQTLDNYFNFTDFLKYLTKGKSYLCLPSRWCRISTSECNKCGDTLVEV